MCAALRTSVAADRLTAPMRIATLLVLMLLHPYLELPAGASCGCHVTNRMICKTSHIPTSAAQTTLAHNNSEKANEKVNFKVKGGQAVYAKARLNGGT